MSIIGVFFIFIILIEQFIAYFYLVKKFKDFFNPVLFTFIFIFFPFFLSHLKLSIYQNYDYSWYIYIIMLVSSNIILFYSILIQPNQNRYIYELKKNSSFMWVVLFSITYIGTYLYENFIISGNFISLLSVEENGSTHLQGVKFFREFNTISRVLLPLLNFYMFSKTGKKIYLILSLVCLLVPLSRGSRIAVIGSIIIILTFFLKKINIKKVLLIMLFLSLLINFSMSIGNERRVYTEKSYGEEVGILNPYLNNNLFGETISWYYGYYSLSIYNFNTSLNEWLNNEVYFWGQANLNGLLSFFIEEYPTQEEFNSRIKYINGAANVPTAYYYYLIDFGIIGVFFFDLLFYGLIFNIYKKAKNDSFYRMFYCYLLLHIINFVFYSSFYAVFMYPLIIFMFFFRSFFHTKRYILN